MKALSIFLLALVSLAGLVQSVRAQAPPTPGIATYAGLTLTGATGRIYTIEATEDLAQIEGWTVVGMVKLKPGPNFWFDASSPVAGKRFYRAVEPAGQPVANQPPFSPIRSGPRAASSTSLQKQFPSSKKNKHAFLMKKCILATLSFASLVSLSSCTLKATGYPASGPAAKNNEVVQAKFTWAGGGSGGVKVTMGDGEICKGRYATVVGGVISSEAATNAPAGWAAQATSGGVRGLQTSRAMLMGDRGRILDFEGYTSGANPTHGFGIAKDNRGSTWKLIW